MAYIAQRTAPDGTVYEEEIPTPEEEAALAASGGIPPPDLEQQAAAGQLNYAAAEPYDVAPTPTGADFGIGPQPEVYVPPAAAPIPEPVRGSRPPGYGEETIWDPRTSPDNYNIVDQYTGPRVGGPASSVPEPRQPYNYAAAEPTLADRRLFMPDSASAGEPQSSPLDIFRPLAQGVEQTVGNVVNTDPAANRRGARAAFHRFNPLSVAANAVRGAGYWATEPAPWLPPPSARPIRDNPPGPLPTWLRAQMVEEKRRATTPEVPGSGWLTDRAAEIAAAASQVLPFLASQSGEQTTAGISERYERERSAREAQERAGGSVSESIQGAPKPDVDVPAYPTAPEPRWMRPYSEQRGSAGNPFLRTAWGRPSGFGLASPLVDRVTAIGDDPITSDTALDIVNAPIVTLNGEEPAPTSLTAQALNAGQDAGMALRGESNLNQLGAQALVSVASNRNAPEPVRAEASRIIGQRLAQEVAGNPPPGDSILDTARRMAQGVRTLDIPTPTLPASRPTISMPDIDWPNVSLPSVDIPTPSLPSSSVSLPSAPPSIPIPEPPGAGDARARLGEALPDMPNIDLSAIPMPGTPDVSGVVGAIGDAASGVRDALTRPAAPASRAAPQPGLQPGDYSPSTNPQTPADWQGATTRSLQLMKDHSLDDWGAKTEITPIQDANGVARKAISAKGADDPRLGRLFVGIIRGGAIVPVGSDVSDAEFFQMLSAADAADAAPATTATSGEAAAPAAVPAPAATLEDIAIPAPDGSSGSRSSSSGWIDSGGDDWSGSRSSGRQWRDFDDDFDGGQDFVWEDFAEQAGGNRRKAEFMARAANRRRRQRGSSQDMGGGGFWPGMPFNRPPSPIRANILTSLNEAFSGAFPNRRR